MQKTEQKTEQQAGLSLIHICGCSVSEKYSDRKRTAEATEGFDKLVQDGMAMCIRDRHYSSREWSLCDADSFRFRWRSYQKDAHFLARPKA